MTSVVDIVETIAATLRSHATSNKILRDEEVAFVAETLVAVHEDNADDDDPTRLAPQLEEVLDSVDWLSAAELSGLSLKLAQIFTGSSGDEPDSDEDEHERLRAMLLEEYALGRECLAILTEDGDWHPARIVDHPLHLDQDTTGSAAASVTTLQLVVRFVEFDKKQTVTLEEVILDKDIADDDNDDEEREGLCAMCERPMRLTFHHLTPRETHARYLKMGHSREFLNTGIMICRPCHSRIHSTESNKTLAREYNTLDKLMQHPAIIRWVAYARKQRASNRPLKRSKWPVGR